MLRSRKKKRRACKLSLRCGGAEVGVQTFGDVDQGDGEKKSWGIIRTNRSGVFL